MSLAVASQQIVDNWNKIRVEIRRKWPQLSQADLELIDGDSRKLIALVHQKTGLRLDEIEEQIDQIATNSFGLLDRVSQSATSAISTVAENVNSAGREIRNSVATDIAKSHSVMFGVGFLIGFCAVGLTGAVQGKSLFAKRLQGERPK